MCGLCKTNDQFLCHLDIPHTPVTATLRFTFTTLCMLVEWLVCIISQQQCQWGRTKLEGWQEENVFDQIKPLYPTAVCSFHYKSHERAALHKNMNAVDSTNNKTQNKKDHLSAQQRTWSQGLKEKSFLLRITQKQSSPPSPEPLQSHYRDGVSSFFTYIFNFSSLLFDYIKDMRLPLKICSRASLFKNSDSWNQNGDMD